MLKKILRITLFVFLNSVFFLCGCSDGGNSINPVALMGNTGSNKDTPTPQPTPTPTPSPSADVPEGYIRINMKALNANYIWIWDDFADEEISKCTGWNSGAVPVTGSKDGFKYFDIKLAENPKQLSFIVRSTLDQDGKLSGNDDVVYHFPNKWNQIYMKSGSGNIYLDKSLSLLAYGISGAKITGENEISVETEGSVNLTKENIKVIKGEKELTVTDVSSNKINISENLKELGAATVIWTDDAGNDARAASFSNDLIDTWFDIDDSKIAKLGFKSNIFTTWAPTASDVSVLLFKDANDVENGVIAETIPMIRSNDGTWKTEDVSSKVTGNKYYKYRIKVDGITHDVCDIWAKTASKNSKASAIETIKDNNYEPSYVNPFTGKYSDAVIYEMHITDWSQAFRPSIEKDKPGTFKEITDALGTNGSGELGQHLKDLGITHVQILPMFEYEVVKKYVSCEGTVKKQEETATDTGYNWGYNPYNYNTPESRYVNEMEDASDSVDQLREMIKAFHDAGISVIMDVVYNHTSGTKGGSIYDMTIPDYFYTDKDYSGCGNAIETKNKMVEKYIIDSMKHWMNNYHINGFRFDLMGILQTQTMKNIYDALYDIDPNVMVYGEPWTGSGTVSGGAVKANTASKGYGFGAFDDDFRDSIKGKEFGGFGKGQIQGIFQDDGIIAGLTGKSGSNKRNETGKPGLSIHYVECHDNYTLFDKLSYSTITEPLTGDFAKKFPKNLSDAQINLIKSQEKLAAAYIFLSQGTPFINGGQEFMRTKLGNPDSYACDLKGGVFWDNIDQVNAIDLNFKEKNEDVFNVYKGLIALRKTNKAAFGDNTDANAEKIKDGVTRYVTGNFLVYFNASDAAAAVTTTGYSKEVDISSGEVVANTISSTSVPAKSFVIFKKN